MSFTTNFNPINSKIELKINNVITTADLKQRIDITLFNRFKWGLYHLEYYGGRVAYIKDVNMQGRVTIFQSGKMISTGGRSIKQSIEQLKDSMSLMDRNNLVKSITLNPVVRNIVATVDIGKKLNLLGLAQNLSKSIYEPEQFPGLIFRMSNSCTFLIFSSGKLVITRAKSNRELNTCVRNIFQLIRTYI